MSAASMRGRAITAARRNGGAGLAASAALHLVLFLLLGLALRYAPVLPVAPTIEVRLVTLSNPAKPQKLPPPRPTAASTLPTALALHVPPTAAPPAPGNIAPAPVVPPAQSGADALRRGLRLTLGCAHPEAVDLSPAEQETCRRMTARAHAAAPNYAAVPEHIREREARDAAERGYRNSTSLHDYPGSHCLLNETCTPDQPTEAPPPGKEDCPWAWCHMVGR